LVAFRHDLSQVSLEFILDSRESSRSPLLCLSFSRLFRPEFFVDHRGRFMVDSFRKKKGEREMASQPRVASWLQDGSRVMAAAVLFILCFWAFFNDSRGSDSYNNGCSKGTGLDATKRGPGSSQILVRAASSAITPPGLNTTAAYIRFNHALPQRIPLMVHYEPFFYSLTISMPDYGLKGSRLFDPCNYEKTQHQCMAEFFPLLPPEVTGLMVFHFDVWVHPQRFMEQNFSTIWYLDHGLHDSGLILDNTGDLITDRCFDESCYPATAKSWYWFRKARWFWAKDQIEDKKAFAALKDAKKELNLDIDDQICFGWSDLWYLPRAYFDIFSKLSLIFHRHQVFFEVAIPTIFHVIQQVHNLEPQVIKCWGSCCRTDATADDIQQHRCGHKINWQDPQSEKFLFRGW
jgi:hypothetical protein